VKHVARLRVLFRGKVVGNLAQAQANGSNIVFEYAPEWLKDGFDISPKSLVFGPEPQIARDPLFGGLHGVFSDSLPDGWGLLLMDRFFQDQFSWSRVDVSPLDRLAYIGTRAMGALEYEPEHEKSPIEDRVDLSAVASSVEKVLSGSREDVLRQLRIQGGSPGGARPKVTVAMSASSDICLSGFSSLPDDYQHWLVKFRSREDSLDMGLSEKTYAEMAFLAGVSMPETKIIDITANGTREKFFAVRRFDREGNLRCHVATMAGLFYANFRAPCIDYQDVLSATSMLTKNIQQVEQAFRLMAFNVFSHNKDDHAKNFSFIRKDHGWELSPAYDLTFSSGMGNEHTTAILGSGNPGPEKMLDLAKAFHLKNAERIIGQVRYAVSQWGVLAKENRVSGKVIKEIGSKLNDIDRRFSEIEMVPSDSDDGVAKFSRPRGQ
jgi:serine/threonine-protein kinase HipA